MEAVGVAAILRHPFDLADQGLEAGLAQTGAFVGEHEALAKLSAASREKPEDEALRLDAIDVLMQLGRNEEAGELLGADYTQEAGRANALRARLALAAGAADTVGLEAKLAANPLDHASRLELARAYAAENRFRDAMEAALEVVVRDRGFDEGAGRTALLQLF